MSCLFHNIKYQHFWAMDRNTLLYVLFKQEWRENTLGAIPTDIIRHMNKFEKISMTKEVNWSALDPATVAVFLKPDLVGEYKYSKNDIIICGESSSVFFLYNLVKPT